MLVSIIIPAYNAENVLPMCLEACLKQTYHETEVIVIDDGSTDRTQVIGQSYSVNYIRQDNSGPAAARNRGAHEARGEIIAFTDSDCVPKPDWIENLVHGFKEGVVGVGGTYGIANPENRLARMVHEEIIVRHSQFNEEVDFLGSFNVAYNKKSFEDAQGFDEDFRIASGEDNDLAYHLRDNGGQLCFTAKAVVEHFHPVALFPYLRTQMRHGFWRMKLYTKHPGRSGGDKYAGIIDLAAPPLALLLLISIILLPVFFFTKVAFSVAVCMAITLLCMYVLIHLPLPLRMVKRTRDPVMILFTGVTALRSFGRAIGMVCGIWHFIIRRKATIRCLR